MENKKGDQSKKYVIVPKNAKVKSGAENAVTIFAVLFIVLAYVWAFFLLKDSQVLAIGVCLLSTFLGLMLIMLATISKLLKVKNAQKYVIVDKNGNSQDALPTPAVAPTPVVKPAPVVEPTPYVAPTPVVKPAPVVEPTPYVAPTPVVKPAPVVEPTPVEKPKANIPAWTCNICGLYNAAGTAVCKQCATTAEENDSLKRFAAEKEDPAMHKTEYGSGNYGVKEDVATSSYGTPEQARLEAERKEKERLEAEAKAKAEREEAERKERERLEAEAKAKAEREEAERKERERLEAEAKAKAEREEAERKERERLEAEAKAKAEREEAERLEAEARAKAEREAAEAKARAEREAAEAKERAEREAAEHAEKERLEAERAEKARIEAEREERLARLAAREAAREAEARKEEETKTAASVGSCVCNICGKHNSGRITVCTCGNYADDSDYVAPKAQAPTYEPVKPVAPVVPEPKPVVETVAEEPASKSSKPKTDDIMSPDYVPKNSKIIQLNSNEWECGVCGKINRNYVGTCSCGNGRY